MADNPRLAKALPALAAKVIEARASAHGVRPGVIAILHTFNGKLEFNLRAIPKPLSWRVAVEPIHAFDSPVALSRPLISINRQTEV